MRKSSQAQTSTQIWASFRDPAGFVYKNKGGEVLRQINNMGAEDFDLLIRSGLYDKLAAQQLLASHKKLDSYEAVNSDAYAVIKPEQIWPISYPFEWSFSQAKDAALLTLQVQKMALSCEMTLKDASAYNVQFREGKPIFIDTLSFEAYSPGEPWQAYRQFCEHFLAPLVICAHTDQRLSQLLRTHIDGIPLDLAAKLLPLRAKARPSSLIHILMHAKAQKSKEGSYKKTKSGVSRKSLEAIIDSLERSIKKLKPRKNKTEWGNYYDITNYSAAAADEKAKLITSFLTPLKAKTVLDLGGNNGQYSRILHHMGIATVCTDIDPNAVESNYLFAKKNSEKQMFPLIVDLTNPGGALGWHNRERSPIHERLRSDAVMALALIHHLAISNNLPFTAIARYFAEFAPHLVIEFVPKEDSQVQKLLATRKDIFPDYNEKTFVKSFEEYFERKKEAKIKGSRRSLYLFKRKPNAEITKEL